MRSPLCAGNGRSPDDHRDAIAASRTNLSWRASLSAPAMAVAWGMLFAGLGFTLLGWHYVHDAEIARAAAGFHFRTERILHAVSTRMAAYEQLLRVSVSLFNASSAVTRDEWRAFVDTAEVHRHFPGIQGLGVVEWIPATEREDVIARVRSEGFSEFDIRPGGVRDAYSAIVFLEPFDWRNRRAFGYDMFTEPIRQAAMARARDTGEPALSGKVTLIQETEHARQAGCLLYLPVYRGGHRPPTVEARRTALFGWVYAPFRMNDLMHGIFGPDLPDIRVRIYDDPSMDPSVLMYDSEHAGDGGKAIDASPSAGEPRFLRTAGVTVAGHDWHISLSSVPGVEDLVDRARLDFMLAGGTAGSVLLFAVAATLVRNRLQAAAANELLRHALAERETLLREVHHRVKNNLQSLWGLLQVERAHTADPALRRRLDEIGQRINVMGSIHQHLYGSTSLAHIDLGKYLEHLCQALGALHGRPDEVAMAVAAEPLACGLDTAIPLGLVTNELVSNSLKHAFPDGRPGTVRVSLHRTASGSVELTVSDDGVGTGQTGTVLTGTASGSIGLTLVHSLVGQLEGSIVFSNGRGCTARVTVPGEHFKGALPRMP